MNENIQILVSNGYVELTIDDFEFIINAALLHDDDVIQCLWDKMDEIRLKNDEDEIEA